VDGRKHRLETEFAKLDQVAIIIAAISCHWPRRLSATDTSRSLSVCQSQRWTSLTLFLALTLCW